MATLSGVNAVEIILTDIVYPVVGAIASESVRILNEHRITRSVKERFSIVNILNKELLQKV